MLHSITEKREELYTFPLLWGGGGDLAATPFGKGRGPPFRKRGRGARGPPARRNY